MAGKKQYPAKRPSIPEIDIKIEKIDVKASAKKLARKLNHNLKKRRALEKKLKLAQEAAKEESDGQETTS